MDLSKIKNLADKAASSAKNAVEDVGKKVKDIDTEKLKESAVSSMNYVKNAASNVENSIKNFDSEQAKETIKNLPKSGLDAMKQHINDMAETSKATKQALAAKEEKQSYITAEGALKILYILTDIDGNINKAELDKFDELKNKIDVDNTVNKDSLIVACNTLIEKSKGDDYKEYLLDEIANIIMGSKCYSKNGVSSKLLLWNLLVLAYSDNQYTNNEKEIVRTVTRRLEIDKNIVQEMELAIQTIIAVNEEKEKIKVNSSELDNRISIILDSIQQLIGD